VVAAVTKRRLHPRERVGGDRERAKRDAEKEPIDLTEDNAGDGLQPTEGSEAKQRFHGIAIPCRRERFSVQKTAEIRKLAPGTQQTEHSSSYNDGSDTVDEISKSSGCGQGEQSRKYADTHCGAVALEGALRADADAFHRTQPQEKTCNAQRPETIQLQTGIRGDQMMRSRWSQHPGNKRESRAEN